MEPVEFIALFVILCVAVVGYAMAAVATVDVLILYATGLIN